MDEIELFAAIRKLLDQAVGFYETNNKGECCCALAMILPRLDRLGALVSVGDDMTLEEIASSIDKLKAQL